MKAINPAKIPIFLFDMKKSLRDIIVVPTVVVPTVVVPAVVVVVVEIPPIKYYIMLALYVFQC